MHSENMSALVGREELQDVLVSGCVAGDEAAWATLYGRYARTIAHFLRRLGVAPDALDDAVQEVFLQAFRSLSQWRGEAAIKTWLYRLAVTHARRARQRARFAQRIRQLLALHARSELDWGEYQPPQAERLLQAALGQLTALEREAFVLYELEGQTGAELAAILGCPEATLYRRLHEARKKFQAYVENEARP
jgi:RNA polymerase sigma-70 factor (ECF subfamily)